MKELHPMLVRVLEHLKATDGHHRVVSQWVEGGAPIYSDEEDEAARRRAKRGEAMDLLHSMRLWEAIKSKHSDSGPSGGSLITDALHSLRGGLLGRLYMEGKDPLPHPPPLHMSRPWYGLCEGKRRYRGIMEVWHKPHRHKDKVFIGQHPWDLVETKGRHDWIVRPEPPAHHWGLYRIRARPELNTGGWEPRAGSSLRLWEIYSLEAQDGVS